MDFPKAFIDSDFKPELFLFRRKSLGNYWWELGPEGEKNRFSENGLYIPTRRLAKNWNGVLYPIFMEHGGSFKDYYPEITGLPASDEVKSKLEEGENPEDFLMKVAMDLTLRSSSIAQSLQMFPHRKFPEPTEFENKVAHWGEGYGFLVPDGLPFHAFTNPRKGQYEVVREYFFHIPAGLSGSNGELDFPTTESLGYWEGIILSMGVEPNSNRCIWGFRQDLATEFPHTFPKALVNGVNYLTLNLETILS